LRGARYRSAFPRTVTRTTRTRPGLAKGFRAATTFARVVARWMVELSAEHDTLPRAELDAVSALDGGRVVEQDGPVALVEGSEPSFLAMRLALAHSVSEHWATTDATPEAIADALGSRAPIEGTFAVRVRRLVGSHAGLSLTQVARAAGAALGGK